MADRYRKFCILYEINQFFRSDFKVYIHYFSPILWIYLMEQDTLKYEKSLDYWILLESTIGKAGRSIGDNNKPISLRTSPDTQSLTDL